MKVSFHPLAQEEVDAAQGWYEARSRLAAAGFIYELSRAVRRIAEAPHRYPIARRGTRRILLERFPFNIVYRATDTEIVVVAVAHQKRRPHYWAGR